MHDMNKTFIQFSLTFNIITLKIYFFHIKNNHSHVNQIKTIITHG